MKLSLLKWLRKGPDPRLKISEQRSLKGFRAFVKKPIVGYACWFLMWFVALLLAITEKGHDANLSIGQPSNITLVSSIPFSYFPEEGIPSRDGFEYEEIRISEGAILVEYGQMVTSETVALVEAYRRQAMLLRPLSRFQAQAIGNAIILLLGIFICAALFYIFKPDMIGRNSMLFLFVTISLLTIIPSRWFYVLYRFPFFAHLSGIEALLLLSLSPLLAAILMGPLPAIIMGFWLSLVLAVFSGYSLAVFVTSFVVAVVVSRMTRFVRTRASVLRMGLCAGFAGAVCALGFSIVGLYSWQTILFNSLFIMGSAILSALIALIILPFLEIIFRISTDISLLELSDLEHPLLKRLAIEAPGTYHHSLMVANLAQAAISAIGGNALQVNICSYFHDIGKLVKPAFFSENTRFSDNPHDDISPNMSTLIVISHVKEGVNLALRYKLPQQVVNAIQQHHGTGIVYCFYHKARENKQLELDLHGKGAASQVKEEDFRYPGPKPMSREIAVLNLADSIEAASRSLEKVSSSHVEHLVNNVVNMKLSDSQLDMCPLTLAEIGKIKQVFIFTLTNMLHSRISYPNNENRNKQQTAYSASGFEVDKETSPDSDEESSSL